MSALDTNSQALDELLVHIRSESSRECVEIEASAMRKARAILQEARHQARARVMRALTTERAELKARCMREQAAAETRLRTQQQQLSRCVLDQAGRLLSDELEARWHDPVARREWASAALRSALAHVMARSWRVYHPQGWPAPEREAITKSFLAPNAAVTIDWIADPVVTSGLRIEADGADVDATARGLLVRREQIEGRLLTAIGDAARTRDLES